jgi:hypothetical protein
MIDLEELLRRGGADVPAVVAAVDAAVVVAPDDTLLAVGSLVEDLGSCKSDIDLYLITGRDAARLPEQDQVAVTAGTCLVDILILPAEKCASMSARLEAWANRRWSVVHAAGFPLPERTILHRLANGRVLHGPGDGRAIRPSATALARLKLHVARQNARTIQVDMVGYRSEEDYRSLVFAGQTLLGDAVDALLAGHGYTNPLPKWRSRLLERLPEQWEDDLAGRRLGRPAVDVVWDLHRAPDAATESAALEHAFRITTFARRVFAWAERVLLHRPLPPHPLSPAVTPAADAHPPLPCLDLDVDFALGDGYVALARLNDFGDAVTMTSEEFAICLFFDGVSTAREADAVVLGQDRGEGDVVATRLAGDLARARLSVS